MKRLTAHAVLVACLAVAAAHADSANPQGQDQGTHLKSVELNIRAAYPATRIDRIEGTPMEGVYRVVMGRNQAFVDASGRYFLFGRFYDMETQTELFSNGEGTDTPRESRKIDFSALPLDKAIRTVRGEGKRVMAVFSDPDCPYCRKLEHELAGINNVTIYTFLMPLASLHPDARRKAEAVWCATDPATAWAELMLGSKEPSPAKSKCPTPLDEIARLGDSLGIQGTPFLIAADGRSVPGAMAAERIEAWLNTASPKPTTESVASGGK